MNLFSQTAYPLTGTSYFQDFNSIAVPGTLPTGWGVYTNSTAVSIGVPAPYGGSGTNCGGPNGFFGYNSAVAGGSTALGVRQSAAGGNDPGTSFDFYIANTQGRTNFTLSFYLQSLCAIGGRTITWNVDYGFGASPATFTNATTLPVTLTTSSTPSSTLVNVNFGGALNNSAGPVWIRIVTKNASAGGGGMPYTAIDNFNLNWTCNTSLSVGSGGTVCNGNNISLSASPTGTAPYTYSWAGPNAFTSTTQNPVIASATAANAGTYTCIATSSGGCAAKDFITVPVNTPACSVTSATVCSGSSSPLSVSSTTTTTSPVYSNDSYLQIPNGGTTVSSNILVSGIAGTVGTRLTSVKININHPATSELTVSLTSPSGTTINLAINRGAGALFTNTVFSTSGTAIASGTNPFTGTYTPDAALAGLSASNISGVWSLNVVDNSNNSNLGGLVSWELNFTHPNSYTWSPATGLSATTGTIVTANPVATTLYTVVNTDYGSCTASAVSTFSVSPAPTVSAPSNQTVCQGANANFSVTAAGGVPGYVYQWQVDNGGGYVNVVNGGVYSGATTANLLITGALTSMNSYRYKCNVTDACASAVPSGVAQLFVTAAISVSSSTASQPITTSVGSCESNVVIMQMYINMNAGTCPSTPALTNINITMNGTSAPVANQVSNVQIYYTGATNSFSPINQFGLTQVANTTISFSGSQTLTGGNNYFWLVYDMNPAGGGAVVDATWQDFTVAGGNNPGTFVPTVTDPGSGRNITTCVAPGGVINGLTYWLKSNDGVNVQSTTHDAPIGVWGSSYSNQYDLRQTVSTKMPAYKSYSYDTTFNYNPYLYFDGSNDILQNANLLGSGLLKEDALAIVVCANDASPNNQSAFGYKDADGGPYFQLDPESGLLVHNVYGKQSIDIVDFSQPATDFPMAKAVGIWTIAGSPGNFLRNWEMISSTNALTADAEDGLSLGGNGDALTHGNSKIAEVITYNAELTSTEVQQIQSYVGIKYGLHMKQDYLASDGFTVIWDYSTNALYDYDIAGIARDDKSGLNQKQSQSVNTDEILTVGLTSISTSNLTNTESFDSDKTFLLWGNNDEITVSDYSTLAPTATPLLPAGIQGRIKRVWKFQGTNFNNNDFNRINVANEVMATKTLTLGFDAHILAGTFVAGPNNTIKLLVDDDGVDWSNAVVVSGAVVVTGSTASGLRILFPNVTVEPGKNFVTLATTNASMLPLASEITHFSAECKSNYNLVKWITATEIDVDNYILQRSINAIDFYDVYSVVAKGNSGTNNVYTFEDANPLKKQFYYRLKQKTDHGSYVTSKTITTDVSCGNSTESDLVINIIPNPVASGSSTFSLNYFGFFAGTGNVKIKNLLGGIVSERNIVINELGGSINFSALQLQAGIYLVELTSGNQTKTVKFIKE